MQEHTRHALRVLEYERMREVLSSYAASSLGRALAARLEPLSDAVRMRERLAETVELQELARARRVPLAGLSDVAAELRAVRETGRPAEPEFLYRVVELIRAGQSLREALGSDPELYPHLARLASGLHDIAELRERIPLSIDPRDGVRDEASEKLSAIRAEVRALREELRRRTGEILRRSGASRSFQSEGVALKQDRYLLPVKAEYRSWVPGPIRERSQSGATLYIEPEPLVGLGDRLLARLDDERDEVTRILWELTRVVLERREELGRLQSRLARVDFTWAKASWASAFDLEAPEIVESGGLRLHQARHPWLLWLARDPRRDIRDVDLDAVRGSVVPLDLALDDRTRILIVTGPNTGGKTVALKTVGLSVLLALSGVPIAARSGSRVPIYRDLFADIGDEQSIEQSLSTFSSHLRQVSRVLDRAGEHSLVLLDELGSGTDPLEGAALGKALLRAFDDRGCTALITTHLGSLKHYAYLNDGAENAAMEFDERSLEPTYRMLVGIPGRSNALAIARRLGIDEKVIEAAREELAEVEEPTREIIERMEASRRRTEKERRRAEKVRKKVQREARAWEAEVEEAKARKESLDREAEVEVERQARRIREELEPLVRKLQSVPKTHQAIVAELEARLERLLVATALGEKREIFARSLRKGDQVYVPKFRARGVVKKINKTERRLTVLIEGVPVAIGFDDISWVGETSGDSAGSGRSP